MFQASKIMFPTDFSPLGDAGLAYATALAKQSGAELLIVHVEEPPLAYGGGELYAGATVVNSDELREALHRVKPKDPAVPFEHRMVMGSPAREIVRLADEEHVDLIVMSTHGRTGLSRLLMGSVAEEVVRRAACPVFTLRQPGPDEETPAEKTE